MLFTPSQSESAADSQHPQFALGAKWNTAGTGIAVQMYVWDKGASRIVEFVNPVGNALPLRSLWKSLFKADSMASEF